MKHDVFVSYYYLILWYLLLLYRSYASYGTYHDSLFLAYASNVYQNFFVMHGHWPHDGRKTRR
jgi:hypothetical protein